MDVRKTVTDAGYIAIGLGVMGAQRAQARGRALQVSLREAGDCLGSRSRELETKVRETVSRVHEVGTEMTARVEPLLEQAQSRVDQVQGKVAEIPERVVQVIEPVTAAVRERLGTAAA